MSFFDRLWRGARPYRYETEQLNHADQLAETKASIDAMSAIPADATGEEAYWRNHHRVGMQDRLAILLQNPRPTVEQLNERDMIQGFLGPETPAPRRLFTMPSLSPLGLLGSPAVWMAALVAIPTAWGAVQTGRLSHAKHELEQTRETAAHNAQVAVILGQRLDTARAQIAHDQTLLTGASDTIEHERAIAAHAARRERERQREVQSVLSGGPPPAWSLQPSSPAEGGDSGQPHATADH